MVIHNCTCPMPTLIVIDMIMALLVINSISPLTFSLPTINTVNYGRMRPLKTVIDGCDYAVAVYGSNIL